MTRVALLTYNKFYSYQTGIHFIFGQKILVVAEAFTKDGKKSPDYVTKADLGWQMILQQKQFLERVIIFLGKYSSGTREIILRTAEDFADKKEIIFFVLCPHELKEKRALLVELGFLEKQWIEFKDNNNPCKESASMIGCAIDFPFTNPPL